MDYDSLREFQPAHPARLLRILIPDVRKLRYRFPRFLRSGRSTLQFSVTTASFSATLARYPIN